MKYAGTGDPVSPPGRRIRRAEVRPRGGLGQQVQCPHAEGASGGGRPPEGREGAQGRPPDERQGRLHRRRRRHRVPDPLQTAARGDDRLGHSRQPDLLGHRGPRLSDGRRHQRLRSRRRLRALPRRQLPGDGRRHEGRLPRDEARDLPGLGRNGPVPASRRGRQRHRVDRLRRAVVRGRRPEDRRGGRRRREGRPPRGGARRPQGRSGRQARLEEAPRREDRPARAGQDRVGDGLRDVEGVRRREGRSELPRSRRRHRGDREGGAEGPRRGAPDRDRGLRPDRPHAGRRRPRQRLPRRPDAEEDREEGLEGGAEGGERGRPRRRDHGGRHRLPVGVEEDPDRHEGHQPEGDRPRACGGGQAPREAGLPREDDARRRWPRRSAGSGRPSPTATSAPSTSSSRRSSRTRR